MPRQLWMVVLGSVGLGLGLLTFACSPTVATPTPTSPDSDPFAAVRATSLVAYATGEADLQQGQLEQALIALDTAKTNDPDNNPAIQQALDEAIHALQSVTPTTAPPSAASPAPAATQSLPAASTGVATQSLPALSPPAAAASTRIGSPGPGMQTFRDPQGRFTLSVPSNWTPATQPRALFGSAVAQYVDPSGRVEADVAIDTSTQATSPELEAATLQLALDQQVPDFAPEQAQPGTTAGVPSFKLVFTFTQHDATGAAYEARGFQIAMVRSSTAYLLAGSAPADQFQDVSPTFDQIVASFHFS